MSPIPLRVAATSGATGKGQDTVAFVDITWSVAVDTGADSVDVQRAPVVGNGRAKQCGAFGSLVSQDNGSLTFTDSDVQGRTEYCYRLAADVAPLPMASNTVRVKTR